MKNTLVLSAIVLAWSALASPVTAQTALPATAWQPSPAYGWVDVALEATAHDVVRFGPRPTVGSRAIAIVDTAMFDAWAAYDDKAVGTRLGGTLRRPPAERTAANKVKALSFAAYRALVDLYPADAPAYAEHMGNLGYDAQDTSTDVTTPQGVGNRAAAALIAYRHHDGANQLGDEVGSGGKPYSDYTYYRAVNTATAIVDPDRWQPIAFDDGKGGTFMAPYLTPYWYRVKPFALDRADQLRPPPPPLVGSAELDRQVKEVVDLNANLTAEQKALIEFMRDGPKSTAQAGHWHLLAQEVARRDHNDLDRDVKMFFVLGNAAMDAFIASWEAKRYYDSSRPWTLVHYGRAGKQVRGWAGPGKGVVTMAADKWHPYSPYTFITPPFAGYVSGHSTVSGACGETLRLFTGSDAFGARVTMRPGAMTEPGFESDPITLTFATFTAAADAAGLSRVLGGYHIQADNVAGLKLGRQVADLTWRKASTYIDGSAGATLASER